MNSAQRMERMVGDLLDVTRARLGGSIPLKRRAVDLQQVCDAAMIEIRVSQPDAVVRLEAGGQVLWGFCRISDKAPPTPNGRPLSCPCTLSFTEGQSS